MENECCLVCFIFNEGSIYNCSNFHIKVPTKFNFWNQQWIPSQSKIGTTISNPSKLAWTTFLYFYLTYIPYICSGWLIQTIIGALNWAFIALKPLQFIQRLNSCHMMRKVVEFFLFVKKSKWRFFSKWKAISFNLVHHRHFLGTKGLGRRNKYF